MSRCIDADRLCKDILLNSFEDAHRILHIIENQPTSCVRDDIFEDIEKILDKNKFRGLSCLLNDFAELKKKYMER